MVKSSGIEVQFRGSEVNALKTRPSREAGFLL